MPTNLAMFLSCGKISAYFLSPELTTDANISPQISAKSDITSLLLISLGSVITATGLSDEDDRCLLPTPL